MITRYIPVTEGLSDPARMEPHKNGEWVYYEDYAHLKRKHESLKRSLAQLAQVAPERDA